ncbi:Signal peptidase [Lecanosticta acicola]|uniref:Mitochondrial inner membrane protease subunit n=1 Tax=Lecanosticta acicola TaxID=111012 RepID=A0AAI9ECD0_9PEZI|nr:Signal peptidase [Lecanosticta acicola]
MQRRLRALRDALPKGPVPVADAVLATFIGIATVIFLHDNVLQTTPVTGISMSPTLSPHYEETGAKDSILWRKYRATRNLKRGDVILFDSPTNPENVSVKRVVGLSGDEIVLDPRRRPKDFENGRVSEGGKRWDAMKRKGKGRVVVPEGHVWVEGDNWRKTLDSNDYGPISKALIQGKAVAKCWPLSEFGRKVGGAEDGYKNRTRVRKGVRRRVGEEVERWWEVD